MTQICLWHNMFGGTQRYSTAPAGLKIYPHGVGDQRRRPRQSTHLPSWPDEREVGVCLDFLKRCRPTKTARVHSYGLKHRIEAWSRAMGSNYRGSGYWYISNGATIEAARRLGLVLLVAVDDPWNPNAVIGVSRQSVEALMTAVGV